MTIYLIVHFLVPWILIQQTRSQYQMPMMGIPPPMQFMPPPMPALPPPLPLPVQAPMLPGAPPPMGFPMSPIQSPSYYPYQEIIFRKRRKHGHSHYSSDYSDSYYQSDSCDCDYSACDQCMGMSLKRSCCQPFCNTCYSAPGAPNPNQGVVLVPYPYPLVISATSTPANEPEPEQRMNTKDIPNVKPSKATENTEVTDKPHERDIDKGVDIDVLKSMIDYHNSKKTHLTTPSTTATTSTTTPAPTTTSTTTTTKTTTTTTASTTTTTVSSIPVDVEVLRSLLEYHSSKKTTPAVEVDADILKSLIETHGGTRKTSITTGMGDFRDVVFKVPSKGNAKYVLTSMRRVKQDWMPKYGIVPIPNNVATDLMTQLRSMKVLQAKQAIDTDNTRRPRRPVAMDIVDKVYGYSE